MLDPVVREDWLRPPAGLSRIAGGSVSSPEGFAAGGAACGLKASGALDVGVLVSLRPAVSTLLDTVNALPAAPVVHNRGLDRARLRAVVVNSGNANASTGAPGIAAARAMGARGASALGVAPGEVAVCSTGVIGETLDLGRVLPGVDRAARGVSPRGGPEFAAAICTTDRALKAGAFRLDLSSGPVTIGAAAKGAGMISPTMATMLAYVTTDAAVDRATLDRLSHDATAASFNRISVDGQMSPSDTLIVMATGTGAPLAGADAEAFGAALACVCRWLAVQIVKDGEGADHTLRLLVRGAADAEEADVVARRVGDSPLVKTAAFGKDPNWGRVSQAVGQALAGRGGAPARLAISFDGLDAADPGVAEVMARPEYDLVVSLGRGDAEAELWISDLTHAYVTLNAEYHT